ncbi:glycosyltransferase family 4 protein, partial [Candidatus Pacearchaeota archaeon]|nr:glycosyltransferase family 4 protein [Candidatus Pacearchaeota archaeon]
LKVSDDEILILWAGRICNSQKPILDEKGLLTLLKAFSVITPRYKKIKLLIAAAEPVAPLKPLFEGTIEQIQELAKLYNISSRIIVKTFTLDEMPTAYNSSDIFVMPSQMETFGLVYAEALACGIPVIGTAVGGVPEIIENDKNGFIIPPDNSIELAHKLEFLINNPEKRKEFGIEGRKKVIDKFALDKVTSKLLGVYNSIIYKKTNGKENAMSYLIKKFKGED